MGPWPLGLFAMRDVGITPNPAGFRSRLEWPGAAQNGQNEGKSALRRLQSWTPVGQSAASWALTSGGSRRLVDRVIQHGRSCEQ